ncbi:BTAD domain-containing putative transcriptional regulator [Streptomyces sp. NPDC019937]|uniref:AfsR/SARP family transcriptional regulator n=1 Tax=Streptomyces sp. NPDC019937 TaxID=3154787 RepID=UPI0033C96895
MRFEILGPMRAWRSTAELDLGVPQQRALLGLLLIRAGEHLRLSEIVDVLWAERPPATAVNVVHRYVGLLRRLLEPELPPRAAGTLLPREAGGYRLLVARDSVDLLRHRDLAHRAGQAAAIGHLEAALELFTDALALWRGPVATGVPERVRRHQVFGALDREYLDTVAGAADAALRCDRAERVVGPLRQAVTLDPLDEPLHARLVLALAASGHRAQALAVYDDIRTRLAEDLDVPPGAELRAAHQRVTGATVRHSTPAGERQPPWVPPAQLPADLAVFSGRRAELDQLLAMLPGTGQPAAATAAVISGMAGIGKSTLAVHWAHRIADRFPDGQLYLNLRGFDPGGPPTQPAEAIAGMLHALGVPPRHLPTGLDAQAALYRSLLAGRRVLVVLDNARDHDQVRPLLPGGPGCLALVTSRSQLPGLVASDGAVPVPLRLPPADDARAALVRRIGHERAAAEPRAVEDIVELCGRLPLALAIVAARAALHPGFPLAAVATELRRTHGSLDAFADTGSAIDARAAFSWSYDALSAESARAFRLLALHPGPDLTAAAAASLTGLPPRRTRTLLAELTRAHLLTEHSWGRYAFHDLVRAYATELVEDQDTDATRRCALHRMLDHYVHTAHPAALLLSPDADLIPPGPALPGVTPETLTDDRQALDWLTAEYTGLLPALERAAASGFDAHLCRLAWALEAFFDRRGHWHDWHTAQRAALAAARRLADPEWEAFATRSLARVDGRLGHYAEARTRLDRAAEAFDRLGDTVRLANTHRSLGWTSDQQGDLTAALAHNQRALDLFRAAGHRAAEARVLNAVGWYLSLLGRYDQALAHCEQALVMMRETGDRYGEAATWDSVGHAHHHLGQYKQAVIGFHNALTVYRELGVPYQEADTLARLGDTHHATGEHTTAGEAWRQALTLFTELGRPDEAEQVRARMRDRTRERGLA